MGGRKLAAVVPINPEWRVDTALRPFPANDAPFRIHLLLHAAALHDFDGRWRSQIQSHENHVHAVRRDIADGAAAEFSPAAPYKWMVDLELRRLVVHEFLAFFGSIDRVALRPLGLVRPDRRRSEPHVPTPSGRHRVLALRTIAS